MVITGERFDFKINIQKTLHFYENLAIRQFASKLKFILSIEQL